MWLSGLIWLARKGLSLVISLAAVLSICFLLSQFQPDDPALRLAGDLPPEGAPAFTMQLYRQRYLAAVDRLHLNRPKFYFSFVPSGLPDTLLHWADPPTRAHFHWLWMFTRDWDKVMAYEGILDSMQAHLIRLPDHQRLSLTNAIRRLEQVEEKASFFPARQDFLALALAVPDSQWQAWVTQWNTMLFQMTPQRKRPVMPGVSWRWHGSDNQFHYWMSQAAKFEFELSLVDGRSPQKKIAEAFFWTFSIHLLAALLALVSAIFIGIYLAAFAKPQTVRWVDRALYLLYAMPVFWLATLAVTFFTTDTYSPWLDWFPSIGVVQAYEGGEWISRFFHSVPRIILPVLVIVLGLWPYLIRQMRQAVQVELGQDYVFYARAKGLTHRQVVWHHAVPNSWFPLLTILSNLLPWLISGSVTIEYIFNIPGMGRLMYDAVVYQDWPVVFALIMLSALLTALGMLLVEWLYRLLDPRTRQPLNPSVR